MPNNPDFIYDVRTRRYRNTTTGRFLSRETILNISADRIQSIQQDLKTIGELLLDGRINLTTWQQETARTLKSLHTQQYLLGIGGKAQIRREDYLDLANELKNQYEYLRNFAFDCTQGVMSKAQFRARLALYSEASKVSYFRAEKKAAVRAGNIYARRILGIAKHCPECLSYARRGIVAIEEAILPTQQCSCKVKCHCRLVYVSAGGRRKTA